MSRQIKTILLADDEDDLRMILHMTLKDPDCEILEAADGISALALARAKCPDLLILDWMMPGMSGFEVVQELRQDPAMDHIPIIMLTARDHRGHPEPEKIADIYAYLVKPFSPLHLLEKVREALASSHSSGRTPST